MAMLPDEVKRFLAFELGPHDDLTPPDWMFHDPDRVDGSYDVQEFISIGNDTVSWFVNEGLLPSHRILDVGCGIGRMALPLTRHLVDGGSYDGIEIAPYKVRYCREVIGRRFADFHFHHADVFNKYYNPGGKMPASVYRFPFEDETFNFAFLVSVFTHMLPTDMEHYLSEIARVLKPGAKCIATFRLADAKLGPPYHDYSEVCEIYRPEEPEHEVIYVENYVRGVYEQSGLDIEGLFYGSWTTRADIAPPNLQDIVIANKQK